MYPDLDSAATLQLPKFSQDLGNGWVLLRPRDRFPTVILGAGGNILSQVLDIVKIRRWGRIRLPNGQVARSLWCEDKRASGRSKVRVSRNVKVCPLVLCPLFETVY